MDLLVVGAGTMGRWVARSVEAEVAFADINHDAAEAGAGAVGGRAVAFGGDDRFDAVCIAVPISAVEEAIATQAPRAKRALVDVTGAMGPAVAAMREHAPDRERVSLHPLFAPSNAPGNVAVVADAPGPITDDLREAIAARGNTLFETTPEEHDRAMETVQARAHAAVLAFALAREDVPEAFHTPLSEPLAGLVEQIVGNDPDVYAEIQTAFDGAEDVAAAAERIAGADRKELERLFRQARGAANQ